MSNWDAGCDPFQLCKWHWVIHLMLKCQININVWVGKSWSIGCWVIGWRIRGILQVSKTGDEIRSEDENNPHLENKTGVQTSFSGKLVLEAVPGSVLDLHYLLTITDAHFFMRSMALASLWPATCDCQHWFCLVSFQGCNFWWLPWENVDLQLLWEERHLTKVPSFPVQLFQPRYLEKEGTTKFSGGHSPSQIPIFHGQSF
jgi:hypothetical protein